MRGIVVEAGAVLAVSPGTSGVIDSGSLFSHTRGLIERADSAGNAGDHAHGTTGGGDDGVKILSILFKVVQC